TDYFAAEYMAGRTPNPCVRCNRQIKFGLLFREISHLGFDFMATGHYAATAEIDGRLYLKKPKDKRKDQTYFLYAIDKEVLPRLIFPLSEFTKDKVREAASKYGLSVADKDESQDICFIPGGDYHSCISGEMLKGEIVDTDGNPLGRHEGITKYTVGQRKGLGIAATRALYVVRIDAAKNLVIVGGEDDLLADGLIASNINLFVNNIPKKVSAKVRYASPQEECNLEIEGDRMTVTFSRPQRAIAPGQSVVIYDDNDILIGGGVIDEAIGHH
ncbi:MAG: tRNA 2-thiouridine(34) synthase MnmA, partial [Nitrospinae bacterium]|nr:tRNA 2-thiouridine(34) synthase MnmA [Nitrospinota bacterium]